MKSSLLFIIFGLILTVLTVKNEESSFLVTKREQHSQRKIASDESPKCMRDLFTVENLKKDVQELEEQLNTNKITGNWRHIDLSTLPTPAAEFLQKHGDKIGDLNGLDAGTCQDVPCLYNLVYETPDGIAGYVHYLWFLRTNTYLAADDLVPNQQSPVRGRYNGKPLSLSNYLFDRDELFGLWRISKMIRYPHSTLTYLKEVQRVPRGEAMEGNSPGVCGLAHSDGWIILSDKCLGVYTNSDSGYLFASVFHEMSHQVDFEDGKRFDDEFYRSIKQDYLKMSGFELREYRNSAGQTVREWNLSPDARPVTAYAKTSPMENFAELLAYYRVEGDTTKSKVSDEMFEFARNYYQGKNFEFASLAEEWAKAAPLKRTKDILKSLVSCADETCVNLALDGLSSEELNRIRSEEPDGCRVLSNPMIGQTMPAKIRTQFQNSADVLLGHSEQRAQRETLLARFDELMDSAIAYESFFTCYSSNEECYLNQLAEKKKPQLEEFGETAPVLLSVYSDSYSWDNVSTEVRSFYKSLLVSRDGVMKRKADELWESCKKIPPADTIPPTGTDYIVKDGYMVSSFYNCLNRGYQSALTGSLDAIKLREFSPRNAQEREFILTIMKPRFTEIFDDHLRAGRAKEQKYRQAFVDQQGQWLYNSLRTNGWWRPRGRADQTQLEAACKTGALQMIGGDIFFHLKKDLYAELVNKSCTGIR